MLDKYGHCSMCHCNLMVHTISDWKLVWRLSGKATHMDLNLSDKSKLRVMVCKKCKASYNHEVHSEALMQAVIKGWEKECEQLVADPAKPDWDEKRKESYMKEYSSKEIVK